MQSKAFPTPRDNTPINWVNVIYLLGVPLGALTLVPWAIYHGYATQGILIYTAIHYFIDTFSITTGYHRLVSHKSFEAHPWLKAILMFTGAGAMQNSVLIWATDHRIHHSFEDTEKDPYNIKRGFLWAHWGWMFYKDNPDYIKKVPQDLANDPIVAWQHRVYLPLALFVCFGIPTIAGWMMGNIIGGFVFGAVLRVFVSSHCTFLINSACHYFGKTTYTKELTARDNWFIALFTCGEGFHNFHHKFQTDYRNGLRWFHWDPTKWGINLFSWLGLATNLRTVSDDKILQARLLTEQQILAEKGANTERLNFLKNALIQLQEEHRALILKFKNLGKNSDDNVIELKNKLRTCKKRLSQSYREWNSERKLLLAKVAA
ncbi:MAG: fatty acid desaturase [Proteobacteria bacterium]|nr:fatty acid desaturase [Pseudomonadota bacterium]